MMALAPLVRTRQPLAALLQGMVDSPVPAVQISGVTMDSRQVEPGDLFLACPGLRTHGLEHAAQAMAAGAAAIAWDAPGQPELDAPAVHVADLASHAGRIASRVWQEPSRAQFVTGITGTDGKTSCAHMLAQALDAVGERCGYLGTLGYGFVDDWHAASHTTPDAVTLQAWLARLLANGAGATALEVSSHALAQQRVQAVEFDVAVLTNIGRDHLDYHGDMAHYVAAKRRLFDQPGLQYAVVNIDDDHGRRWLATLDKGITRIAYGLWPRVSTLACQYVALREIGIEPQGLMLQFDTSWGELNVRSSLIGRFNAWNLAAVLAVLLAHDVAPAAAAEALQQVQTVPGRMQQIAHTIAQPLVVVDYAHTPNALEQALLALATHASGRVHCVFGCGGERDRGKRPLMAAAAARHADMLWLTDDNPRGEAPQAIIDDMLAGLEATTADYVVEHDRVRAIHSAVQAAEPGDAVLIAGKGHEAWQQIGAQRRAHDDRIVARQALEAA